jgi:hypothetical protein
MVSHFVMFIRSFMKTSQLIQYLKWGNRDSTIISNPHIPPPLTLKDESRLTAALVLATTLPGGDSRLWIVVFVCLLWVTTAWSGPHQLQVYTWMRRSYDNALFRWAWDGGAICMLKQRGLCSLLPLHLLPLLVLLPNLFFFFFFKDLSCLVQPSENAVPFL